MESCFLYRGVGAYICTIPCMYPPARSCSDDTTQIDRHRHTPAARQNSKQSRNIQRHKECTSSDDLGTRITLLLTTVSHSTELDDGWILTLLSGASFLHLRRGARSRRSACSGSAARARGGRGIAGGSLLAPSSRAGSHSRPRPSLTGRCDGTGRLCSLSGRASLTASPGEHDARQE